MVTENEKRGGHPAQDAKTREWLVGLRIGLALAEGEMSEVMRRAGRIDVLDDKGKVIFTSRIDRLPALQAMVEDEAGAGAG